MRNGLIAFPEYGMELYFLKNRNQQPSPLSSAKLSNNFPEQKKSVEVQKP